MYCKSSKCNVIKTKSIVIYLLRGGVTDRSLSCLCLLLIGEGDPSDLPPLLESSDIDLRVFLGDGEETSLPNLSFLPLDGDNGDLSYLPLLSDDPDLSLIALFSPCLLLSIEADLSLLFSTDLPLPFLALLSGVADLFLSAFLLRSILLLSRDPELSLLVSLSFDLSYLSLLSLDLLLS